MDILFTKISDQEHALTVRRQDGSTDSVVLNSRSFLRHDLAHLAVELELPLARGFWGSVAKGQALGGKEFKGGPELALAEALSGPVQTLLRTKADSEPFLDVLNRICPEKASWDLAARIRERGRRLQGHWQATPYGDDMRVRWEERELNEVNKNPDSAPQSDTERSTLRNLKSSFAALSYGTS